MSMQAPSAEMACGKFSQNCGTATAIWRRPLPATRIGVARSPSDSRPPVRNRYPRYRNATRPSRFR